MGESCRRGAKGVYDFYALLCIVCILHSLNIHNGYGIERSHSDPTSSSRIRGQYPAHPHPSTPKPAPGYPSTRRFLWREALCAPRVYPPDLVLERGVDEAVALEGV